MNVLEMVSLTQNDILKFDSHPGRYMPIKWYGIKPAQVSRTYEEWRNASPDMVDMWIEVENSIVSGAVDIRDIDTGTVYNRVSCRALTVIGRRRTNHD